MFDFLTKPLSYDHWSKHSCCVSFACCARVVHSCVYEKQSKANIAILVLKSAESDSDKSDSLFTESNLAESTDFTNQDGNHGNILLFINTGPESSRVKKPVCKQFSFSHLPYQEDNWSVSMLACLFPSFLAKRQNRRADAWIVPRQKYSSIHCVYLMGKTELRPQGKLSINQMACLLSALVWRALSLLNKQLNYAIKMIAISWELIQLDVLLVFGLKIG